jgi:hypothetical protein
MVFGVFPAKAARMVASGVPGAVVVDGAKRLIRARATHNAAVLMTSWGLRGIRAAETGAEKVRLIAADIVSEARGRMGDQSLPPASATEHRH